MVKRKAKNIKDVEVEEVKKAKKEAKEVEEIEETEEIEEEVEEVKEVKEKEVKKDGYFRSVRKEMKKVVWPKAGEVAKYTLAVIIFCLLLVGFFTLVVLLVSFIKGLFA
jgi:preprotein translocase SecE subunit